MPVDPRTKAADPGGVEEVLTEEHLLSVISDASASGRYAIDTEFHRERTYYPQLALVQLRFIDESGTDRQILIDPLALDPRPLAKLFASDALAVIHAATQDLEVFEHAIGTIPTKIFDTQIAAGFLGLSTPSLRSLVQTYVGITISKGDRMTDWLRRPLSASQRAYAIGDVAYLFEIADQLTAALTHHGRLTWAEEACEDLRTKDRSRPDPASVWISLTEIRQLRGEQQGAGMALAEWREHRARQLDIPPRRVMGDVVLVCIAQQMPDTREKLTEVRGFTNRKQADMDAILEAVARGRTLQPPPPPPRRPQPDQFAVALVSAWIGDLARRVRIDRTLIATREEVEGLVLGEQVPLAEGWRAELVGDLPARLCSGTAGLALDPAGGLRVLDPNA